MSKKTSKQKSSKKDKGFNYKSTPEYAALTDDEKKLVDLNYSIQSGSSKYTNKQLKEALGKAKKDSSGYMKQVLREFQTGVSQQVAQETGDYQSHLDTINENIKEINEDLATGKETLSLEEQRVLSQQARDYEQSKGQLVSQIASTGTGFSSIGEQQKTYAAETQKGLVEGTTATYDTKRKALETQAARGNIQAQQQLSDLNRQHQQNISGIGLKAETYLGSKGIGDISGGITGYTALGGISGQAKEESTSDIAKRQQAYLDTSKQASLQF